MIYIAKNLIKQMIEHSRKEFPNEACGILSGASGTINKVYEMVNTEKSPETFFMDPKEQLKVIKDIRKRGTEMLGIYHSHAASAAYPSSRDIELALYPDVSYIIVSLQHKKNPSVRSFKITEGRIAEEELKTV